MIAPIDPFTLENMMLDNTHPAISAVTAAQAEHTRLTLARSNLEGRLAAARASADQAQHDADHAGAEALLAGEGTGTVTGKTILDLRRKAADTAASVREIETALKVLPDKLKDVDRRMLAAAEDYGAAYAAEWLKVSNTAMEEFADGFRNACLPALLKLHAIAAATASGGLAQGLRDIELALPSQHTANPAIRLTDGRLFGFGFTGPDGAVLDLRQAWQDDPASNALAAALMPLARLAREVGQLQARARDAAEVERLAEREQRRGEPRPAPGLRLPEPPYVPPPRTFFPTSYEHRQPGTASPEASAPGKPAASQSGEAGGSWAASAARVGVIPPVNRG